MRITVDIDDDLLGLLRTESDRRNQTMSTIVEEALRLYLARPEGRDQWPPLPIFEGGGYAVDIADRDVLYEVMEGRSGFEPRSLGSR